MNWTRKVQRGKALRSRASEYLRETMAGCQPAKPAELCNGAAVWHA